MDCRRLASRPELRRCQQRARCDLSPVSGNDPDSLPEFLVARKLRSFGHGPAKLGGSLEGPLLVNEVLGCPGQACALKCLTAHAATLNDLLLRVGGASDMAGYPLAQAPVAD